jgi:hypothetical protein
MNRLEKMIFQQDPTEPVRTGSALVGDPLWHCCARWLLGRSPGGPPVRVGNPRSLISNRFDVHIKYLYAKALEDGEDLQLFRRIYSEHLRVWNGFRELHPPKHSFADFDNSFKAILKSIRRFGFSPRISLIPVCEAEWYPVNGSHRIAAAMLYCLPEAVGVLSQSHFTRQDHPAALGTGRVQP